MPIKGLISKCVWNIEVLRQAGKIEFELSCRLEIVGEQQNGKTDWLKLLPTLHARQEGLRSPSLSFWLIKRLLAC